MVKKSRYAPEEGPAKNSRYSPEVLQGFKKTLEAQLSEFQSIVSDLPPLPTHPIKFEGWFRDVTKRLEITSQMRTTQAHLRALRIINLLHEEWHRLGKINYELSRIGARANIDDLKIKVEEKELQLQLAKIHAEMREVKTKKPDVAQQRAEPKPEPPPQESYEDRIFRQAKREFDKWIAEDQVKEKIIKETVARGKSEEDAKAFADEIIQKLRKRERYN